MLGARVVGAGVVLWGRVVAAGLVLGYGVPSGVTVIGWKFPFFVHLTLKSISHGSWFRIIHTPISPGRGTATQKPLALAAL